MADLLIDLGNTRMKLAWLDDELEYLGALEHLGDVLRYIPAQPRRIWLASVAVPGRLEALRALLDTLGGELMEVSIATYQRHLPTLYDIHQLGVDRWLAALAAYARTGGNCVVVDAGTATTIDVVDARGRHVGGYILPGLQLMASALQQATAMAIPNEKAVCDSGMPRTTAQAVQCGGLMAQATLIGQVRESLGDTGVLLLGGGNREPLCHCLSGDYLMLPQLVLEGLACLARREA